MSNTTVRPTLNDFVVSAEQFATLRGITLTSKPEASAEDRAVALIALAEDGSAVKAADKASQTAHEAWLAAKRDAQETRANLAIAMLLLSEQGVQNTALNERFAVPGGKSAVPTWLRFAEWVLASVAAGGSRNVTSGDADKRSDALSEGWNAILAAKKAGALNDKSFTAKIAAAAAPGALRIAATEIAAAKQAAKQPQVDPTTPEPQSTGTDTGATAPVEPVAPVVPGTTETPAPEEQHDDALSLDADTLRNVALVTATMERIVKAVALGTLEGATVEAVFAAAAEWVGFADATSEACLAVMEAATAEAATA